MVGLPRSRHRSLWVYCATGRNKPADACDKIEMIEADAGELGERDGQDREIDAGDAEAEREKADDRAAAPRRPEWPPGTPSHGATP